jgi:hypothetical protein
MNTRRYGACLLSNLCLGKPPPEFLFVSLAIPVLANLLQTTEHEGILTDACRALKSISDDDDDDNTNIYSVVRSGVCQRLVELLNHSQNAVVCTRSDNYWKHCLWR